MNFDFGDFAVVAGTGKDAVGSNIFCVGQSGSGKTVTVQHIVNCLPRVIPCHLYTFKGWSDLRNVTSTTDAEHMTLDEVLEDVKKLRAEKDWMHDYNIPMFVVLCGVSGKISQYKKMIKECNDLNIWFMFDAWQFDAGFISQLEDICEYQVYMKLPSYIADGLLGEDHRIEQPYGSMCMRRAGDSLRLATLKVCYDDLTVSDNSFSFAN